MTKTAYLEITREALEDLLLLRTKGIKIESAVMRNGLICLNLTGPDLPIAADGERIALSWERNDPDVTVPATTLRVRNWEERSRIAHERA